MDRSGESFVSFLYTQEGDYEKLARRIHQEHVLRQLWCLPSNDEANLLLVGWTLLVHLNQDPWKEMLPSASPSVF